MFNPISSFSLLYLFVQPYRGRRKKDEKRLKIGSDTNKARVIDLRNSIRISNLRLVEKPLE